MSEGWHKDDYFTLFDAKDIARLNELYGISTYLKGHTAIALLSWDDFILIDESKRLFTAPTVPLVAEHLAAYSFPPDLGTLQRDERFAGKVKWYIKPIVFGGDPSAKENMAWISVEEHAPFVRWWNDTYLSVAKGKRTNPVVEP